MSIHFDPETRVFRLYTLNVLYAFRIDSKARALVLWPTAHCLSHRGSWSIYTGEESFQLQMTCATLWHVRVRRSDLVPDIWFAANPHLTFDPVDKQHKGKASLSGMLRGTKSQSERDRDEQVCIDAWRAATTNKV